MGSESSKDHSAALKYGQIHFQPDRSAYHPGDTLTGKIYINIFETFPGHRLFLKIKGKEQTFLGLVVRTQKGGARRKRYTNSRVMVNQTVQLHTFETLTPGQYAIPLSFLIPSDLPPSFYDYGAKRLVKIGYQVEVFIQPDNTADPKITQKQTLLIYNPLVRKPEQKVLKEQQVGIYDCCGCCCSKGTCTMRAYLDKEVYSPGETVKADIQLDNTQSQRENLVLSFSLRQALTVDGRTLSIQIVRSENAGVPAGQDSGKLHVEFPLPPAHTGKAPKIQKGGPDARELIHAQDDFSTLKPTMRSKLIVSEYFLEVVCPMEEACCTTQPVMSIPIIINYPDAQLLPPPPLPAGVNPQELPHVTPVLSANSNAIQYGAGNTPDGMINGPMVGGNQYGKSSVVPFSPGGSERTQLMSNMHSVSQQQY